VRVKPAASLAAGNIEKGGEGNKRERYLIRDKEKKRDKGTLNIHNDKRDKEIRGTQVYKMKGEPEKLRRRGD